MPSFAPLAPAKPIAADLSDASPTPSLLSSAPSWPGLRNLALNLIGRPAALEEARPIEPSNPSRNHADTPIRLAPPAPGSSSSNAPEFVRSYFAQLECVWWQHDWSSVTRLNEALYRCWIENRQVFLCGNGGSAANAIHLANDLLYGVDKQLGRGLRVTALPANASVLTCLANDIAYEDVFAQQLAVLAQPGDLLLAFSGSGNSPNIVKALLKARDLGLTSFAVLGFSGGRALELADHPIHFPVHDMQVAEDLQTMVGHMAMQWLSRQPRP